ncbi:hypothetical protein [Polyangium mundeleinium]|uniref:Uncharacterized protein n=1 Tax=Polyangium mundeleinium TaxID=2995306 RepID=A0ABT5ERB0_9BACT|nr:hypothetical protein [Polyangium mundeleinium]MDC0744360.1 hypothetical protein [Polyangium mundeleinium]
MSATWFLYSPLSPRAISALADEYERHLEAYIDEHVDRIDEDETVPEVAAGGELPPVSELQAAYALAKRPLSKPILARYRACKSVITLDQASDLEVGPCRGLVSTLRYLLPRAGEGALVFPNDVPLVPVEEMLARIENKRGLPGFDGDDDDDDDDDDDATALGALKGKTKEAPDQVRALRVLASLEGLMNDPELSLDLRGTLQRSSKLAQRYAALLVEDGAVSDARASKELGVTVEELTKMADALDRTLLALKE